MKPGSSPSRSACRRIRRLPIVERPGPGRRSRRYGRRSRGAHRRRDRPLRPARHLERSAAGKGQEHVSGRNTREEREGATRCASVLVLPVPAPAITSSGPAATPPAGFVSPCPTASRWAALSERNRERRASRRTRTRLYGYPVTASSASTSGRAAAWPGHDTCVFQRLEIRHPDVLGWFCAFARRNCAVDAAVQHVGVEPAVAVADARRRRSGVETEAPPAARVRRTPPAKASTRSSTAKRRASQASGADLLGDSTASPTHPPGLCSSTVSASGADSTWMKSRDPGLELAIETDGARRRVGRRFPRSSRQRAYRPFAAPVCGASMTPSSHKRPEQQEYVARMSCISHSRQPRCTGTARSARSSAMPRP